MLRVAMVFIVAVLLVACPSPPIPGEGEGEGEGEPQAHRWNCTQTWFCGIDGPITEDSTVEGEPCVVEESEAVLISATEACDNIRVGRCLETEPSNCSATCVDTGEACEP